MGKIKKAAWTAAQYERAARKYCESLPLEHFMEALPQSQQRKITLESLDLLTARRPEVQVFSELLVQYFYDGRLRQVVPDNMVRICKKPPRTKGSFNIDLEPVGPLLVLECVSDESKRKDYEESFAKYEQDLKVPYCLMFYPDQADLRVWRHNGESYDRLPPNAQGRYAIPELELEVGLHDGWVRYWHRGELLPLPGELLGQVEKERQQRMAAEAEVERLRGLLGQSQGGKKPRKGG